jgi:hypothetical protein
MHKENPHSARDSARVEIDERQGVFAGILSDETLPDRQGRLKKVPNISHRTAGVSIRYVPP